MTTLTAKDIKEFKAEMKVKTVYEVAETSGWSPTTLRRIKKSRSLKHYKELCNS